MCNDSHLPPAPESRDLIAIIHPVYPSLRSAPALSRRESADSTMSSTSSSVNPSRSSSPSVPNSVPAPISGCLRLSNRAGVTHSEFLDASASSSEFPDTLSRAYAGFNVRIHQYGSGSANPVMYEFGFVRQGESDGVMLDLGVGGMGVVGRAVSIVDTAERVLGQGILGRI